MLADFGGQYLRSETHRRDIESVAMNQTGRIGLHQLHAGVQRVGHVHHVHIDVARNRAGEAARFHRIVENLDGIVRRAPARQRDARDDARETDAARIDSVLAVIVVAQQLARDLADAVDRIRSHQRVLRRTLLGRRQAERADRAGSEQRAAILAGDVERVHQRPHVDIPRQLRVFLAHGAQQRDQVENRIDLVLVDRIAVSMRIERVQHDERSRLA